jgi:hypothetical protein
MRPDLLLLWPPPNAAALQIGEDEARTSRARFVCFVADLCPDWVPEVTSPPPQATPLPTLKQKPVTQHWQHHPQLPPLATVAREVSSSIGAASLAVAHACVVHVLAVQQVMLRSFLVALKWEAALENWGVAYQQRGIVGAVVFDTLGYHVPAEYLSNGCWRRRTNVGYLSNVAVAPGSRRCAPLLSLFCSALHRPRHVVSAGFTYSIKLLKSVCDKHWPCSRCLAGECRQGVASKLIRRCEVLALQDPSIDVIALHIDPHNVAAHHLYESLGYRVIRPGSDSPWSCLLGINTNGALQLMVKPLRHAVAAGVGNSDELGGNLM